MLKFFRKIRHRLLKEGRLSSYLLYTIGEILLVMIGILLALQINNWNEYRKDRIKEKEVLTALKTNLKSNCDIFENSIERNKRLIRSADYLISIMDDQPPLTDSLKRHFHGARLGPAYHVAISQEGYEMLKNEGFDIIVDQQLKNQIIQLFEVRYPSMKALFNYIDPSAAQKEQVVDAYFYSEEGGRLSPIDYDRIWDTTDYWVLVKKLQQYRNLTNNQIQISLAESQMVLKLIETQLNKRS